jgi:cell division protein ZapE
MSSDLTARFERELVARGYVTDRAQQAVVARLEALRKQVLTETRAGPWARLRRQWASSRTRTIDHRGIYLWGGVGRGKTWLMDLFYSSLPAPQRRRDHFHHFMRDVHAQLRAVDGQRDPLERVAQQMGSQAKVLCLDELFVSDIADAMLLGGLFEALLRHGVILLVTSNSAPDDLYRDGLQRSRFLPAIALLQQRLEVIHLEGGADYRLRQLQRQPIYLDSAQGHSQAQLQHLFAELAPEEGDTGTALEICGRPLPARRRRGDTVWFEFATLCEGPRGQDDYVELAREFHTVLLSDIPVFSSPEQDNGARRFIALIDEFYDQGVKLVVSAAAPPQSLYQSERLQFEFQRTSSRLIEMQSGAYLARPHRT